MPTSSNHAHANVPTVKQKNKIIVQFINLLLRHQVDISKFSHVTPPTDHVL